VLSALQFAQRERKRPIDDRLIDIHTHVLPGADDGARDDAAALAMLRAAELDGIGTVVATPHAHHVQPETITARVEHLNQLACEEGIDVRVLPGSEVRIGADLVERFEAGKLLTLNGTRYLLLELYLSQEWAFEVVESVIDRLRAADLQPVLAHAERYPFVQREPGVLHTLLDRRVPVQINAAALTGYHGDGAQAAAETLLREGLAQIIASDAHNAEWRPPRLRYAYERAAGLTTNEHARILMANATCIIEGRDITWA
jgi:protein-tyrosine phosphatase